MQDIRFQVDGLNLSGKVFYPEKLQKKNPAILFIHGFTSEKSRSYQYAESLSKLGYICLLFDLRGHGKSEGNLLSFSNNDYVYDVTLAYDEVIKNELVDRENVNVLGSSFGGFLALLLTKKRQVKNIVLRAPADYPNEAFNQQKSISRDDEVRLPWREKRKDWKDTYALEAIHKFNGNVLIIESELDDRIPHQTIQNYMDAVPDKRKLVHTVVKRAPHSIPEGTFRDEVEKILVNWFKNL